MNGCTIIARNYLAAARVLARSFLEHHPEGTFTTLILDPTPDNDFAQEQFRVVTPYEIGIERREFHRMAAIYSVVELATAVKPWLLETMLADRDTAIYLDPDIEVFSPLDDVAAAAREHGIALTPHTLRPLPRDGYEPSETLILRAGMYNLGFIAVGQSAKPFLAWWQERLARECVVAPELGRFVDQRWVDFVPTLFDHAVLRDPCLNVAWWNLWDRTVRWNGRWEIDSQPIRFFHYSGFNPAEPNRITHHAGDKPRVNLADYPDLSRLYREYGAALYAAGYENWSKKPYALARTPIGIEMDGTIRALYREALTHAESSGGIDPPDAFDPTESEDFVRWLVGEPIEDSRPVGANIVGYFRTESGVGEAARQLVNGFADTGLGYSTRTYTNAVSRQQHPFQDHGSPEGDYDVNIICVNADQLPIFAEDVGAEFFEDRYTVGVWFWEAPIFPASLRPALDLVDEVWVASQYIADAVRAATEKPVRVFPLPILAPRTGLPSREALGLPESFLFLFSFDFLSVFERKNPLAVIEAFSRAFSPGVGPTLVIKSINGDRDPESLARLVEAAARRDDIIVMDGYAAPEHHNALIATCDCYVSLHRSEGFGFTMAEALMYERPVIATGHGGNTMFMNKENSFLVPYRLVPISSAAKPYPAEGEWADPLIDEAARLMHLVHDNPEDAVAVAEKGRLYLSAHHTPSQLGRFAAARLKEIRLMRTANRVRDVDLGAAAAANLPPLVSARLRLAEGPGSGFIGPARRGAPVEWFRRVIRRLTWPYLAHQHAINVALFETIQTMEGAHHERNAKLNRIEEKSGQSAERVDKLEAELLPRPYMSDPRLLELHVNGQAVIGYAKGDRPTNKGVYLGFEDIFRGPEDFIRARQRYYVKLVKDREPVLDVGCGRGEFLDLMREHEIVARGIDLLPEMIQHAQAKGHDVEIAEANAYLEAQPDASLGVVFSAQVIEHLSYDELLRFLALAHRKLRPGGILIAETVNPHSLSAFKTFWVDPTHESPIFPEVATALAGLHGYASAKIVFPNGAGPLEHDLRECGEYALVATKGSSTEQDTRETLG